MSDYQPTYNSEMQKTELAGRKFRMSDTDFRKEMARKAKNKIRNKYPADDYGTWQIVGVKYVDYYAPGKPYKTPSLGLFEGTYANVVKHAFSLGVKFYKRYSEHGTIIKMKKREVTVL